jgi:hypothetical protein
MKQKSPEIPVKLIGQPARNGRLHFHRPMDGGEGLITAPFQTRQAMQVRIGHGLKNNVALFVRTRLKSVYDGRTSEMAFEFIA